MHSSGGLERSRARYVQLPHPEVLCRVARASDAGDRGRGSWPLRSILGLYARGTPLDALGSVSPTSYRGRVRPKEAQMLGKLSIAGAVAAILMIPTTLSAQVGGAVNAGAAVRGAVIR